MQLEKCDAFLLRKFGKIGCISVVGSKESFFLNFSEIFVKIALYGVVGSERNFRGFGRLPNKQNAAHFTKRVPLFYACYETYHITKQGKDGKGMEKKREQETADFQPKRGNPANETVTYKIGGTYFEVSTSCGGSEPLFEKMKRLIKSESVKTPTDKKEKVRYNKDSNLSVGRSLQEE